MFARGRFSVGRRWREACTASGVMPTKPPWKRKNPRARRAGRAYPNLVDNMNAAKKQKAAGSARKRGQAARRKTKS